MSEDPISDPSLQLAPLFQWQKTADFAHQVAKLDELANCDLLTDGRWKPLREALVVRDFAVTLGYAECKLCPEKEQFPDAMVRSLETELQIEVTEVLTPGRKRQKEYKEFKESGSCRETVTHQEWDELKQAGSNWVDWTAEAVRKKLKYSKNTKFDILVYNNISHLFQMPEIDRLSTRVGELLTEAGYQNHWVWQRRATTVDLIWPRLLRLKIPGWEGRF